jgi:hypothetical protein
MVLKQVLLLTLTGSAIGLAAAFALASAARQPALRREAAKPADAYRRAGDAASLALRLTRYHI